MYRTYMREGQHSMHLPMEGLPQSEALSDPAKMDQNQGVGNMGHYVGDMAMDDQNSAALGIEDDAAECG